MHQPPPPREAARRPTRIDPVPGTSYGLAIFGAPPATSGPAVGALVAGVAAVLVSFVVGCVGLADAASSDVGTDGWGALVGGAFAVLTGFLGTAAIGLGVVGMRRTGRRAQPADGPVRGRGMAIAGIACGGAGVVVAACSLGVAILVAVS